MQRDRQTARFEPHILNGSFLSGVVWLCLHWSRMVQKSQFVPPRTQRVGSGAHDHRSDFPVTNAIDRST